MHTPCSSENFVGLYTSFAFVFPVFRASFALRYTSFGNLNFQNLEDHHCQPAFFFPYSWSNRSGDKASSSGFLDPRLHPITGNYFLSCRPDLCILGCYLLQLLASVPYSVVFSSRSIFDFFPELPETYLQ